MPAVYWLAAFTAAIAITGAVPGVLDVIDHFRYLDDSPGVGRWALLLFLLGIIQLAYAVYLVQLPDWGSVWVVALVSLAIAATYALVLGVLLMSTADNRFVESLHLLQVPRPQAIRWCFMMLSLNGLLSYFAGRSSVRWHRAFRLLTGS